MKIEEEVKLDFKDVLIRPKRSALPSRSVVDIRREFTSFRHSKQTWTGIPIIAANMDTIGTIEMAKIFHQHGMLTCLHKFYTPQQLQEFTKLECWPSCIVSVGIVEEEVLDQLPIGNFLWYAQLLIVVAHTDAVWMLPMDTANDSWKW